MEAPIQQWQKRSLKIFIKTANSHDLGPRCFTSEYSYTWVKNECKFILCSTISNSERLEATQMSITKELIAQLYKRMHMSQDVLNKRVYAYHYYVTMHVYYYMYSNSMYIYILL
jgi:hypothetical protein